MFTDIFWWYCQQCYKTISIQLPVSICTHFIRRSGSEQRAPVSWRPAICIAWCSPELISCTPLLQTADAVYQIWLRINSIVLCVWRYHMLCLPTSRIASYGPTILQEEIHKADVAVKPWVLIPDVTDSYPVPAHRLLGTSFSRFSQFLSKTSG
jgi:hypothetical protein